MESLLAHRASPVATFTVECQVRLEVEALDVLAVVTSRWKCYSLGGDGTLERDLQEFFRSSSVTKGS